MKLLLVLCSDSVTPRLLSALYSLLSIDFCDDVVLELSFSVLSSSAYMHWNRSSCCIAIRLLESHSIPASPATAFLHSMRTSLHKERYRLRIYLSKLEQTQKYIQGNKKENYILAIFGDGIGVKAKLEKKL